MLNAFRYAQELEEVGFSHEQAEASLKILADVMTENFATKSDIKELGIVLRSEIKEVRTDMKMVETSIRADMKESEARLESSFRSEIHRVDTAIQDSQATVAALHDKRLIQLGSVVVGAVVVVTALNVALIRMSH